MCVCVGVGACACVCVCVCVCVEGGRIGLVTYVKYTEYIY